MRKIFAITFTYFLSPKKYSLVGTFFSLIDFFENLGRRIIFKVVTISKKKSKLEKNVLNYTFWVSKNT